MVFDINQAVKDGTVIYKNKAYKITSYDEKSNIPLTITNDSGELGFRKEEIDSRFQNIPDFVIPNNIPDFDKMFPSLTKYFSFGMHDVAIFSKEQRKFIMDACFDRKTVIDKITKLRDKLEDAEGSDYGLNELLAELEEDR